MGIWLACFVKIYLFFVLSITKIKIPNIIKNSMVTEKKFILIGSSKRINKTIRTADINKPRYFEILSGTLFQKFFCKYIPKMIINIVRTSIF